MLSITSDFVKSDGDPQPSLQRIAAAGFTHIHWCHHWYSDFIYLQPEIEQIGAWFKEYGLQLLNLHASHGMEKYWVSSKEYQRLAGVELVQNRLHMAASLGAQVVILHIPSTAAPETRPAWLDNIRRSLDALQPFALTRGVRLALENMAGDDYAMLETLLAEYEPDFLGLCYDAGHANMGSDPFTPLRRLGSRLIAVHLHDNDGVNDQHKIPFTGTLDWAVLAQVIAASAYRGMVNLEVVIHESGYPDEAEFLRQSRRAGERLAGMIQFCIEAG